MPIRRLSHEDRSRSQRLFYEKVKQILQQEERCKITLSTKPVAEQDKSSTAGRPEPEKPERPSKKKINIDERNSEPTPMAFVHVELLHELEDAIRLTKCSSNTSDQACGLHWKGSLLARCRLAVTEQRRAFYKAWIINPRNFLYLAEWAEACLADYDKSSPDWHGLKAALFDPSINNLGKTGPADHDAGKKFFSIGMRLERGKPTWDTTLASRNAIQAYKNSAKLYPIWYEANYKDARIRLAKQLKT